MTWGFTEGRPGEFVKASSRIAVKDTPITCPKCHAEIGRFIEDVYPGFMLGAASVRFHPDQVKRAGEPATCTRCQAAYLQNEHSLAGYRFKVHTPLGWL